MHARLILLLFSLLISPYSSLPTILVPNHAAPTCVEVESAQDTVLRVLYDAPELSEQDKVFLSVNVRPAARVTDTKLHTAPILNRLRPTRVQLTERVGNITHTLEVDGQAVICVTWESTAAGTDRSSSVQRFAFRVVQEALQEKPVLDVPVEDHLSHMAQEMIRLKMGMQGVLSEADFAKERDSVFHSQTQAMDEATLFWPVVQVCVLVMTGIAQAGHVVRFFKSRRII